MKCKKGLFVALAQSQNDASRKKLLAQLNIPLKDLQFLFEMLDYQTELSFDGQSVTRKDIAIEIAYLKELYSDRSKIFDELQTQSQNLLWQPMYRAFDNLAVVKFVTGRYALCNLSNIKTLALMDSAEKATFSECLKQKLLDNANPNDNIEEMMKESLVSFVNYCASNIKPNEIVQYAGTELKQNGKSEIEQNLKEWTLTHDQAMKEHDFLISTNRFWHQYSLERVKHSVQKFLKSNPDAAKNGIAILIQNLNDQKLEDQTLQAELHIYFVTKDETMFSISKLRELMQEFQGEFPLNNINALKQKEIDWFVGLKAIGDDHDARKDVLSILQGNRQAAREYPYLTSSIMLLRAPEEEEKKDLEKLLDNVIQLDKAQFEKLHDSTYTLFVVLRGIYESSKSYNDRKSNLADADIDVLAQFYKAKYGFFANSKHDGTDQTKFIETYRKLEELEIEIGKQDKCFTQPQDAVCANLIQKVENFTNNNPEKSVMVQIYADVDLRIAEIYKLQNLFSINSSTLPGAIYSILKEAVSHALNLNTDQVTTKTIVIEFKKSLKTMCEQFAFKYKATNLQDANLLFNICQHLSSEPVKKSSTKIFESIQSDKKTNLTEFQQCFMRYSELYELRNRYQGKLESEMTGSEQDQFFIRKIAALKAQLNKMSLMIENEFQAAKKDYNKIISLKWGDSKKDNTSISGWPSMFGDIDILFNIPVKQSKHVVNVLETIYNLGIDAKCQEMIEILTKFNSIIEQVPKAWRQKLADTTRGFFKQIIFEHTCNDEDVPEDVAKFITDQLPFTI